MSLSSESIRTLEEEGLRFVRDLIRIDSVNTGDPETVGDGEARAARYIQDRLEEVGYDVTYVESRPGRGSVIARLQGSDPGRGALVAHAHVDVVPVDGQEWTHPPFGAEIHDGLLYGRGAVDMKDFAGTLVAVARAFKREGIVPQRDVIFAFFADEESGGTWGARWLVEHRPELFAGATEAISEVGGFSVPLGGRRAYLVATAEKGIVWARVRARGRAGHGSRPTADNAVVRVAQAVVALAAHRFPVERTSALDAVLRAADVADVHEITDETIDEIVAGLGLVAPLISATLRETVSPTVLAAGSKTNIIPALAEATLDVRVLPGHEDTYRSEVEAIVGEGVEFEWGDLIAPISSPDDAALVETIGEAIRAEDPEGIVVPYLLPASTDNKHLARLGIRGYGFVPLRVPDDFDVFGEFHAADERVPVDALAFCARVTWSILATA
ncbi:M20/M25/M40 family metallo-hydrolase [Leifsonia poae]|uniref:Peptidase n=1 Tax=Leifsonia poae TaxID=110933 RepID=A0A9W6H9N5_9MICO|nr:M20/M25/M40 family metallo-hydrolase [Leifsonia poae]GLJ76474.1 putative peptidase [Leifsonia poae]